MIEPTRRIPETRIDSLVLGGCSGGTRARPPTWPHRLRTMIRRFIGNRHRR